jgi:hypothetical protein
MLTTPDKMEFKFDFEKAINKAFKEALFENTKAIPRFEKNLKSFLYSLNLTSIFEKSLKWFLSRLNPRFIFDEKCRFFVFLLWFLCPKLVQYTALPLLTMFLVFLSLGKISYNSIKQILKKILSIF